jgi:hypothetical protein
VSVIVVEVVVIVSNAQKTPTNMIITIIIMRIIMQDSPADTDSGARSAVLEHVPPHRSQRQSERDVIPLVVGHLHLASRVDYSVPG